MKNTILTLIILCFPLIAMSQSEDLAELDKQQAELNETLRQQKEYTKRETDRLKVEQDKVEAKKKQLAEIEGYEQNFAQSRIVAIAEITETIKGFSIFQKMGAKAGFYKCLRKSLEEGPKLNYSGCKSGVTLNAEEEAQAQNWKASTGLSLHETKILRETLPIEIRNAESMLVTMAANKKYSEARENVIVSSIQTNLIKRKELEMVPGFQKFINCDASTPEINLEEKVPFEGATFEGAFNGVPKDNQDGLGTCYANAAKNLLVGVSEGKEIASFLDIALAYKEQSNGIISSGLDGGSSCTALEALKKKGFCPQHFAPMENGERNHLAESLFNTDAYTYLATNVTLLHNFLEGLSTFEKSTDPVKNELLGKAQEIIQKLKTDTSLHLPLPIVRHDIPSDWKINETYHSKKAFITGTQKEFLAEYKTAYKEFYPVYMKAVLEGKTLNQVFELYKTTMNPFITKYHLEDTLPEFKNVFEQDAGDSFKDPALLKKLRTSLDFLKEITNKKEDSDADFIAFCSNSGADSMKFLSALHPLIEKLRQDKLNAENLFDKDGKFKSAAELMQLTVAPACLNPENRKKLSEFTCNDGYDTISKIRNSAKPHNEKVKSLREKVVLSLAQGYGVGNTFHTGTGWHINTIVGMRFNKTSQECEYRIRESQTGTSSWLREAPIFDKINALTEVRRP